MPELLFLIVCVPYWELALTWTHSPSDLINVQIVFQPMRCASPKQLGGSASHVSRFIKFEGRKKRSVIRTWMFCFPNMLCCHGGLCRGRLSGKQFRRWSSVCHEQLEKTLFSFIICLHISCPVFKHFFLHLTFCQLYVACFCTLWDLVYSLSTCVFLFSLFF